MAGLWPCHQVRAPRDPAASVLFQVVRDHYHTFRAEASQLRDGEGLPRFVDDEFDAFLRCGWHAGGFARFRCTSCRAERLVEAGTVTARILRHLGLPSEVSAARPARAPPLASGDESW